MTINTSQKYQVGDRVTKSWRPGDIGEVIDIAILSTTIEGEMFAYRVKFPRCEGTFLEQDLVAIITDQLASDKIQN